MKSFTLQLAVLLWAYTGAVQQCPSRCSCENETADCNSLALPQPPDGSWPLVQVLDLTNNNITALHLQSFVGYPNVSVLYLSGNNIGKLDFAPFAVLENLTYLSLWGNGLRSIEQLASGVQLPVLNQLDLSNNKLSELDPNLLATVAPNLQSLYFTDNRFFVLQDGPVLIHSGLQHVSFLRTNMSAMSPQTFQHLPNLLFLVLTESEATNITGAFERNPQLAYLELTGCAVTEVTPGTFAAGTKLGYLSLDANPLNWLELEAVEMSMRRGGFLQISDTPLACVCAYDDVYNWAIHMEVEVSASCKSEASGLMDPCPFF